jgi:hypothetical protein
MHAVILGQAGLPKLPKEAGPMPVLKILMHRASRAELPGQCFPLNAGAQNVNDGRKNLPRGHRLAAGTGLALVLPATFSLADRNQQLNLVPQIIRHCPRLELGHLSRIFTHLQPRARRESMARIKYDTIYG